MANPLLDLAAQRPILMDGGVGTLLQSLGALADSSLELLNLTDSVKVRTVYKRFIEAGSQVICTNTFNGSQRRLEAFGAGGQVRELNRSSVRLAREVREVLGVHTLIAGSVGPIGEYLEGTGLGHLTTESAKGLYRDQIDALVEGGADLISFETFSDLNEALLALAVARGRCDLPTLVMLTFDDDGRTALGQTAAEAALALRAAGASAIGANCGSGPRGVLRAVKEMALTVPGMTIAAKPNAGWPMKMQGRLFFGTTTDYAASFALEAAAVGARLIGGCCGMSPDHIAAMAVALQGAGVAEVAAVRPAPTAVEVKVVARAETLGRAPSVLGAKLAAGQFVTSIEMHPPRTHLTGAFLRAAREYKDAGVELVNLVDSPMARVRMSSPMACALIQERTGLETITHLTPRDRTLLGLQAELIGAHALGVRNILCVTGDPHRGNLSPGTVNVYDVDAIGMIRLLSGYNRGVDPKGNDLGQPTHFVIGGALNPNAPDLELEIERFHQKVEAGIHFCMVQPVFDMEILVRTLERLGRPSLPVIAGICPIHSYQHAQLLHNEIPGIHLTDQVLERMRTAVSAEEEGIAIARQLLAAARHACQGVYIMPSYGRHEMALRVLEVEQFPPL